MRSRQALIILFLGCLLSYQGIAQADVQLPKHLHNKSLSERDRRRENTVIDVKISQLDERIDSAQLIEHNEHPSEVRFGVEVSFKPVSPKGPLRTFKIVGVDEANIRVLKVSFTAPIVQAMMGKHVGDTFAFEQAGTPIQFEITNIA